MNSQRQLEHKLVADPPTVNTSNLRILPKLVGGRIGRQTLAETGDKPTGNGR